MNRKPVILGAASVLLFSVGAWAADHIDSPSAIAEPTADITDVFAWMDADAEKLNLVMDVSPFAGESAVFSDAVVYAFHVGSSTGYGMPQRESLVLCQFYALEHVECWAGDEYVAGHAAAEDGVQSQSGKLKVFAGVRDDPFFMEFTGFTETVKAVVAAAPSLDFDEHGCPTLTPEISTALVSQLQHGKDGAAASDTFAGSNVLSLVVQLDKSLVNAGGGLLSVWASTHSEK